MHAQLRQREVTGFVELLTRDHENGADMAGSADADGLLDRSEHGHLALGLPRAQHSHNAISRVAHSGEIAGESLLAWAIAEDEHPHPRAPLHVAGVDEPPPAHGSGRGHPDRQQRAATHGLVPDEMARDEHGERRTAADERAPQ